MGMPSPPAEEFETPLAALDERLARYRLRCPRSEARIAASLRQHGQLAPVVVCAEPLGADGGGADGGRLVLVDGFKRLRAARSVEGLTRLRARRLELDAAGARAAIYLLNQLGGRPRPLEEAWIVRDLVRVDGLAQADAARLLGRHKSWVCRRLALLEQLAPAALERLGDGLLPVSLARQLVRLPAGNQEAALATAERAALDAAELRGVVDLLLASGTEDRRRLVLEDPRLALRLAGAAPAPPWDPRLSAAGNRAARLLAQALETLGRIDAWLRLRGRAELADADRRVLPESLARLAALCRAVAEGAEDLGSEARPR